MKSEAGKPVFPDDVDTVLAEKIVEHTKKNAEGADSPTKEKSAFPPSQSKGYRGIFSEDECLTRSILIIVVISGILAFLKFGPKYLWTKKRKIQR
jgi:hypothetical protein